MGRIEDLRKSLSDMTPDEKLARIRQIRTERRIVRNPSREKQVRKAKTTLLDKVAKQLKGLSQEQIRELLGG